MAPTNSRGMRKRVFTLTEEANQTSRRSQSAWASNARLRDNPISFTTAGLKDPFQNEENQDSPPDGSKNGMVNQYGISDPTLNRVSPRKETYCDGFPSADQSPHSGNADSWRRGAMDAMNSHASHTQPYKPHTNRSSRHSISSDASDEVVILFKGRKTQISSVEPFGLEEMSSEVRELEALSATEAEAEVGEGSDVDESGPWLNDSVEVEENELDDGNAQQEDYLANLLASGEQLSVSKFHFRDLGDSDEQIYQESEAEISSPDAFFSTIADAQSPRVGNRPGGRASRGLSKKRTNAQLLAARYPVDMTMEQIIAELQNFLISSEEQ